MGHYDSDYEYDAEQRRKTRIKHLEKVRKQLTELRQMGLSDLPKHLLNHLEDIDNWLYVNTR